MSSKALRFRSRILFDDSLDVSRAESGIGLVRGGLSITGGHAWFASDSLVSGSEFSEFYSAGSRYALTKSWSTYANWKYDGARNAPISEEIGIAFLKDCAGFELALTRQFLSSFDISPITSIKFNFWLGLGGDSETSTTASCG